MSLPSRFGLIALVSTPVWGVWNAGCSEQESNADGGTSSAVRFEPNAGWAPDQVYPAPEHHPRGLRDVRGIIHAHSVYSSDTCELHPREDNFGPINEECLADFRYGFCETQHDFVMLTDHTNSFSHTEFPDVLLHQPSLGDTLIERDGSAVANWAACENGRKALILAGSESTNMPVGLERHAGVTPAERNGNYGGTSDAAIDALKDAGAVVLVAHTETLTTEELVERPIDGFEMYNFHANLLVSVDIIFEMVKQKEEQELLPHPNLVVVPLITQDPKYTERWGSVLARGVQRVTTMGTDCHQNVFTLKLLDGERLAGYRRMMFWLSNHLLVRPDQDGAWDDRSLKEALRAGRLYGAFEVFGYPEGFDFFA